MICLYAVLSDFVYSYGLTSFDYSYFGYLFIFLSVIVSIIIICRRS